MNSKEGWVKWWRKAEDCEALFDDKMDKTHAFMYMVMSANTKPMKTAYGEKLKRGQFKTSIRNLATAFGWGHMKTMRFLNELEKTRMISTKKSNRGTVITIEKYSIYQDKPNTNKNTNKNASRNANKTLYKKIGEVVETPTSSLKSDSLSHEEYDLSVPEVEKCPF